MLAHTHITVLVREHEGKAHLHHDKQRMEIPYDNGRILENRNVNIITDADGKKLVLINDIRFKGKRQIDWDNVKRYLEGYVGDYYEIEENAERIYIGNELPEEYTESESRKSLMGANAKAKANAATAIPELIQIASNPAYEETAVLTSSAPHAMEWSRGNKVPPLH